jgi:hypothetical protein
VPALRQQEIIVERENSTESNSEAAGRWLKLLLDAMRDIALSPVSILAGLIDLVIGGDPPGRCFYRVLAAGGRTDAWINLFGESGRVATRESEAPKAATVDSLVRHVERLIVDQYERGGVTASAKEAIDRSLDAITRTRPR